MGMVDHVNGEVRGRVRGRTKTLRLDMAALHHFEQATGTKAFDAMQDMRSDDAGFAKLRELVRGAMQEHHPDATVAEAGAFIAKHPDKIRALLGGSLPEAEDQAEEGAGDVPGNQKGVKG